MQQGTDIMSIRILILVAIIILGVCNQLSFSQNSKINAIQQYSNGEPGAFLRMGVGARAFSLSGAYSAIADDPAAVLWNPAGLSQISTVQMELMNVDLPFDRSFNFVSGVFPIKRFMNVGVSWVGLRVNDIEGRTSNTEQPDYFFGQSQNAFFVSFSRFIGGGFALGGNLKYILNQLDSENASGFGIDASVFWKLGYKLTIGFLVQDIGTDYRWKSGLTEGVPMTFRLGTSYKVFDEMLVSADIAKTSDLAPILHFGVEFRPISMFPLRVGYHDDQISGGAGFNLPVSNHLLKLSYGYSNDKILNDNIHRFSLSFAFGANSKSTTKRSFYKSSPKSKNYSTKTKDKKVIVTARLLNARSGPGTDTKVIAKVRKNDSYLYISRFKNWIKIKLSDGKIGWVHSKYVIVE